MIVATPLKRRLFFIGFDILLSLVSLFLAYNLRFNFHVETQYMDNFFLVFVLLIVLKLIALYLFHMYDISWRYVSLHDVKRLFFAHVSAYAFFVIIYYADSAIFSPFPRSVLMIDMLLSLFLLGGLRIAKRLFVEGNDDLHLPKTLLVGVSSFTQTLLKEQKDFYVTAIVDDSPMVIDSFLMRYKVHALDEMEALLQREKIERVIICKPYENEQLQQMYKTMNAYDIYDIRLLTIENKQQKYRQVTVSDLLARHPQDLDTKTIESFIRDKKVLITGAGGSIGSEIVRQCQAFGAKSLILVEHSEYNLYQIAEQVPGAIQKLVSVTDRQKLDEVFAQTTPDIVIHAAAYKHVPICEANQESAVENNVLGSKNVIDLSIAYGVQKVVVISTDKAVRPTNVMGATKRVTELYAQNVDAKDTEIVAVRFGNVLGSSGSVIPKFKAQIEAGGPVTVTHPEITRYFMLIPEACQLVLQAAAIAKGGELFILDMGEPVKIIDLARKMIKLYGKEREIEIKITGLRPGEKLYEELLLDEREKATTYRSIFIAKPTRYAISQLLHDIKLLLETPDKVEMLKKIVPEFTHKP